MIPPVSGWKRSRHFATLGLSQVNSINEQIKNRMNAAFGHDYNYTYLFPGMRNAQAASRAIRTALDYGVVHLIDERYCRLEVMRLLPVWWKVKQMKKECLMQHSAVTYKIFLCARKTIKRYRLAPT